MDTAQALGPTWMSRLVEVLQPLSLRADRLAATTLFAGVARPDLEIAAALVSEALAGQAHLRRVSQAAEFGGRLSVPDRSDTRGSLAGTGTPSAASFAGRALKLQATASLPRE
jgi:hypothetical protein